MCCNNLRFACNFVSRLILQKLNYKCCWKNSRIFFENLHFLQDCRNRETNLDMILAGYRLQNYVYVVIEKYNGLSLIVLERKKKQKKS